MSNKVMKIVAEAASEVQNTLITTDHIKSHSRKMEIVRARQFYHYVMRKYHQAHIRHYCEGNEERPRDSIAQLKGN